MTFDWELVVLHTRTFTIFSSMHLKLTEHVTKKILLWFTKGQTHFCMPRGAKTSLALQDQNRLIFHSILNATSEHAPQVGKN